MESAEFIWTEMRDGTDGSASCSAAGRQNKRHFSTTIPVLIHAFIALYQACWDGRWLDRAQALASQMIEDFEDRNEGGFFTRQPIRHRSLHVGKSNTIAVFPVAIRWPLRLVATGAHLPERAMA
jgi:uncharacterized protein YyaL (SSP411 family)